MHVNSYRDLEVYKLARQLSLEIFEMSNGEQQETQHWIETALDCGYITVMHSKDWLGRYASVGRMLNSMIKKADSFCSQNSNR